MLSPNKATGLKIKLSYISGLRPVVLDELEKHAIMTLDASLNESENENSVFIAFSESNLQEVKKLRSVARAYLVLHHPNYNPTYISNHKSIIEELVNLIIEGQSAFKTFKISCAGADSPEVRSIAKFIIEKFNLKEGAEADLKIHFIKPSIRQEISNVAAQDIMTETPSADPYWEIGIQITPRPLSVRDYRAVNMSGAMDPTIAYAVNSFCNLETASSYLNIFSGSATLLIEAGLCYENLEKLIGFDNHKKHLSLSIQNIKQAGLIKKVKVIEADIFDMPDLVTTFGKFDAIVSDLPFGMVISKDKDLHELYTAFIKYCETALNKGENKGENRRDENGKGNRKGRLVVYTSEYELIRSVIEKSKFKIVDSLPIEFYTNANAYLKAEILVCEIG